MREAGQADVPELTGLMREFYAESGFVLDEELAATGFKSLLADARLGRVWLIEQPVAAAADHETVAAPDEPAPAPTSPAAGYIVVSFVFAMEYAGLAAVVDDFYVRPEARGEGLGKAALAAARRACQDLGVRAMRVEVGVDNLVAQAVYRSAGFEALPDHGLMAAPLAPPAHEM
jgi:ribosomal protein S18 acetylase RimI-like enzyme